ncbi:MAG TPA: hypothetical protein PKV21_07835 [bacterium]|nr:hypothetical protein [bacterium]HOM27400.1 hypothetical protein [bacterium]
MEEIKYLTIENEDEIMEKVDILVENQEGVKIGFHKQKDGVYKIIPGKVSSEKRRRNRKNLLDR